MPAAENIVATKYWRRLEDGRVQCDLCPRECKLREGQAGLCFVRARQGGEIVLTTWGRSSGYCVDPIEKKPLFHFLPGTPVLSFGTAGCNLACRFCQNWDISKAREDDVLADSARPETIAMAARDLGCASVAFTYNDPIVFHEYAIDVAEACHELGVRTVAVSSGYVNPEPRAEFYRHIDAVNVDLKAFTEHFYHRICSAALAPVLDTLRYIRHETDVWLELTTLLIPGENDSDGEIDAMARWVFDNLGPEVPMHFTAFYPAWKMLDRPPTPPGPLPAGSRARQATGGRVACRCGSGNGKGVLRPGPDETGWNYGLAMFDFIWGNPVSRFLVTLGIVLILAGIVWPFLQRMGIGRLPGDIIVEREGFRFYFPVVTSILLSLALTLILWFINR
jgi:pyruvate formate lyase activating enzyme